MERKYIKEKIIESFEKLNNSYEKLLALISGGAIALSVTFLINLDKKPDIFCIFGISLFLLTASLILILLGTFCGLKARSKNIGKITAEEDEDKETAKKLKKSKEKWNCCADFAHNISLASCIIGIIMLLFFIYITASSL